MQKPLRRSLREAVPFNVLSVSDYISLVMRLATLLLDGNGFLVGGLGRIGGEVAGKQGVLCN